VVRAGETLWSISQRYGTTVSAVARANRLEDPTQIRAGQRLYIPGVKPPREPSKDQVVWRKSDPRGKRGSVDLAWPLRGRVSSGFGMRHGAHHDGVDIPAKAGTPVRAAEAGRVIHSGNSLAGYGNLVIIKHAGNLSTVYAHNRRNLVRVGEFVERGQVIAEVGRTGRATANHVHFEVRRNGSPRNPLDYLP
jgi:murein DD-endopeptidase MepM/ murein hydrolase activator NlpD